MQIALNFYSVFFEIFYKEEVYKTVVAYFKC